MIGKKVEALLIWREDKKERKRISSLASGLPPTNLGDTMSSGDERQGQGNTPGRVCGCRGWEECVHRWLAWVREVTYIAGEIAEAAAGKVWKSWCHGGGKHVHGSTGDWREQNPQFECNWEGHSQCEVHCGRAEEHTQGARKNKNMSAKKKKCEREFHPSPPGYPPPPEPPSGCM